MLLKAYINRLDGTPLFRGISREVFEPLLSSMSAKTEYFKKGEDIFKIGEEVSYIGVLLSGEAAAIKKSHNGADISLYQIIDGEVFGEIYALVGTCESPIRVVATQNSAVMLFEYSSLMNLTEEYALPQLTMISNLMRLIARKNLLAERHLEAVTKRTIREKLMTFLESQSDMAESESFVIPYNREGLSDYLCVDRSALSRELCKLQEEGVLDFKKNIFTLHRSVETTLIPIKTAIS